VQNVKDKKYLIILGKRIRELRKLRNLTQLDLAIEMNNHAEQIGRLERGELNFTICMLKNICKAFAITEKEFFDF
jgi:transcriptional regulator with XRE-family HTH domain